MSSRRRLLQIIASSFKWLAHSFTNLYYSLIPTTINGKKVQDKAQVNTIYGNSVVENQLIAESSPHPCYQSWTIDNSQSTSTSYAAHQWNCDSSIRLTIGHKYLIWFSGTKSYSGNGACKLYINVANRQAYVFDFKTQNANIITIDSIEAPESLPTFNTILGAGAILTVDGYLCFADLTQWFPFNTPTTLTDTRVQEIINRGHIPYNTGTLKSVNIGEISSEPYNLLVTQPIFNTAVVPFNSQTFTKLKANKSYTLEFSDINATSYRWCMSFYDVNGNIINDINLFAFNQAHYFNSSGLCLTSNNLASDLKTLSITPKIDCYVYVNFGAGDVISSTIMSNVSLHLTGSRTGYAPHTQSYTLPFKYQGSGFGTAHDTLEDGGTEWIFTKAMVDVDLGAQNFVQKDNGSWHFTAVEHSHNYNYTDLTNIVCSIGEQKSAFTLEQKTQTELEAYGTFLYGYGGSYNGFRIFRSDLVNKTVEEVQTAMAGIILKYELATPQVTRIPKKHLAVVDLGTINWTQGSSNGQYWWQTTEIVNIKYAGTNTQVCNVYCRNYLTRQASGFSNAFTNALAVDTSNFKVKTDGLKNGERPIGYLFYETEDEVDDIIFDINIEAGGSVTTNWFSWAENQLAVLTRESATLRDITFTKNGDNDLSVSGASQQDENFVIGTFNNISGHKYLARTIFLSGKPTDSSGYWIKWKTVNYGKDIGDGIIFTGTATESSYIIFTVDSGNITTDCRFRLQVIDLTLGFGAGNEPTSINDPRIQYIIKQGYISTNTTGTNKSVASEVLPNIDFKMKCK